MVACPEQLSIVAASAAFRQQLVAYSICFSEEVHCAAQY
jgi:hypothetical protein